MRPARLNLLKTDDGIIIPIDYRSEAKAAIVTGVTGTIDYTIQETFDLVQSEDPASVVWNDIPDLTGKTAGVNSSGSVGATAIKFVVNTSTGDPTVTLNISQPNEHS